MLTLQKTGGAFRLTYQGSVQVAGSNVTQTWDLTAFSASIRQQESFKRNLLIFVRGSTGLSAVQPTVSFVNDSNGVPTALVLTLTAATVNDAIDLDVWFLHSITGAVTSSSKLYFFGSSSGVGGSSTFIYQPSAAFSFGNVYKSWAALYAAFKLTQGPQTIFIDDAVSTVPGGSYNFEKRAALVARNSTPTATVLQFGDGALAANDVTLQNLVDVYGSLTLKSRNVAANVYEAAAGSLLYLHDGSGFSADVGSKPFYAALTSGSRDIFFTGRSNTIAAATDGSPALCAKNGTDVRIRLQGVKGTITPYALQFLDTNTSTRVRIYEYNNDNGLISIAQPTAVAGQLNYPRFTPEQYLFGGNLTAVDDYLVVNGTPDVATPNAPALPSAKVENLVGVENQLRQIVWNSDAADATTVLEIMVVMPSGPNPDYTHLVTLTGARGALPLLPFAAGPTYNTLINTLGARIAVRHAAGTAPGNTSVRLQ